MKTSSFLTLVVLIGLPQISMAQEMTTPTTKPTAPPVSQETSRRLRPLAEALAGVSQQYKVSILADAYAEEGIYLPESEWEGRPAADAIQRIAKLSARDVFVMDGIYVLRHKRWAAIRKDAARADYPLRWNSGGAVTVTRLDSPKSEEPLLPARNVQIAAYDVSCSRLVSELRNKAAWEVRVTPEIGERRLHVYAADVSPSSLLGGMAFLLNAGPEVVLRASKDQQVMEEEASVLLPDFLKKRMKPSEQLRADLEKELTPEQRQALANGEYVPLSVSALPKGLQERALEYIKLAASLNTDLVPPPDMSRWKSFQIRFHPVQSGTLSRMLGVVMADTSGNEFVF